MNVTKLHSEPVQTSSPYSVLLPPGQSDVHTLFFQLEKAVKITVCVLLSWFWCRFQDLSHTPPPWHVCWLRASAEDIQCLGSSRLVSSQHLIVSYCIPTTAILEYLRQIMPLATRIYQFMGLFPGSLSLGRWWRWAERWQCRLQSIFIHLLASYPTDQHSFLFSIALRFISSILNIKLTGLRDHLPLLCLNSSRIERWWSYNPAAPINISSHFSSPKKVGSRWLKVLYSVLGYLTYLLTRTQSDLLFADDTLFI